MAFNEAQKQAILHKEGPMLVLAGPGSGKTTVITNRIRYLTRYGGVSPSSILVITFTRAAAREMEERYNKMSEKKKQQAVEGSVLAPSTLYFPDIKAGLRVYRRIILYGRIRKSSVSGNRWNSWIWT